MKIKLSSDEELVATIREGLKNKNGHCPCMIEISADTKCMCKMFREQTTMGPCHCGLYIKEE